MELEQNFNVKKTILTTKKEGQVEHLVAAVIDRLTSAGLLAGSLASGGDAAGGAVGGCVAGGDDVRDGGARAVKLEDGAEDG